MSFLPGKYADEMRKESFVREEIFKRSKSNMRYFKVKICKQTLEIRPREWLKKNREEKSSRHWVYWRSIFVMKRKKSLVYTNFEIILIGMLKRFYNLFQIQISSLSLSLSLFSFSIRRDYVSQWKNDWNWNVSSSVVKKDWVLYFLPVLFTIRKVDSSINATISFIFRFLYPVTIDCRICSKWLHDETFSP